MSATTVPRPAKAGPRPAGYGLVRARGASFLIHRRSAFVAAGLLLLLAASSVAYLCVGERFVGPSEVVRILLGQPSPSTFVVEELREPRLVVALAVGAAFGVAGALIQTVARNPLASPDIIGISQGAGAVTVAAMTFGIGSYAVLPYLSIAGGVLAAALVYVFAWRGGLHATRFVLIGIGFAIALRSLTTLFMTKGDFLVAQQAQIWMTGSLNGRGWEESAPSAGRCCSCCPPCCGRPAPSGPSPSTTTRRRRWAPGSGGSGSGSSRSVSSSRPWRPGSRVRSTSWRSSRRRSPAARPAPRRSRCSPRRSPVPRSSSSPIYSAGGSSPPSNCRWESSRRRSAPRI